MNLLDTAFWTELENNDYHIYINNGIIRVPLNNEISVYLQKFNYNLQMIFQTTNNANVIGKWCFQLKYKNKNEWTSIMSTPVYKFNSQNHLTFTKKLDLSDYSDIHFEWIELA